METTIQCLPLSADAIDFDNPDVNSESSTMKALSFLTKVLFFIMCSSSVSWADTVFEGYYKITMEGEHIGYYIQRYSLDPTTKLFSSTYYMFTKVGENTTIESLNAKATTKFEPHSYQYTQMEGTKNKVIDAVIKNKKLVTKIVENGKATIRELNISDKVFFSTFMSYLVLKTPKGFEVNNKFTYDAIAEEDGTVGQGEIFVKEQVKESGLETFRTLNTFKKEQFINWINVKGESIKTQVPRLNITAELVRTPKEAYATLPFSESSIKLLFGGVPAGKTNLFFGQ